MILESNWSFSYPSQTPFGQKHWNSRRRLFCHIWGETASHSVVIHPEIVWWGSVHWPVWFFDARPMQSCLRRRSHSGKEIYNLPKSRDKWPWSRNAKIFVQCTLAHKVFGVITEFKDTDNFWSPNVTFKLFTCHLLLSVWEIIGQADGGLSVLRTFRLLRVLKLVRFLPALRRQLVVLMKTMDNVATFCMLLMLFIFTFRCVEILNDKKKKNQKPFSADDN